MLKIKGVIFVVDSTDKQSELLSKMELFNLLINEDLKNAVFLIMANKQDVKEAMTVAEISEKLCLTEIKNQEWHIQVLFVRDISKVSHAAP